MITNYKIFEGTVSEKIRLKNDIIKIFNNIDNDIMKHIRFNQFTFEIGYDIYYDNIKIFSVYKGNDNNGIDYVLSDNIAAISHHIYTNYDEYIKNLSTEIDEIYNLKYINTSSNYYLLLLLEEKCLFFNKKIFNDIIIKYIEKDKDALFYYNNYEHILTDENKEEIEHLINAKNFDLL